MANKHVTVASLAISGLRNSPLPSSVLYQRLKSDGVPAGQARTTVARLVARHTVRQYKLILGKGNRILTLHEPRPDADLLKGLYENEFFGRPALRSFIYCLATSHPVVTSLDVAKLAVLKVGAPPSYWQETNPLIEAFEQLGVLDAENPIASAWVVNRKMLADAGIAYGNLTLSWKYHSIRNLVRTKLTSAVADWMRNNTFLSDKGTKVSSDNDPPVSLYRTPFDVVGFCFTRGVARRSKSILEAPLQPGETSYPDVQGKIFPSPVIGDCLIEECNLEYARSFYRRVWEASSVKGKRAPIPFVFAKYFAHDAFKYLKGQGVLVWTHSQLLGTKTAEAIERLLSISENLVAQQNLNPQFFVEIFEGFENFQGVFGQLKGKLFELLMAYFFQRRFTETRLGWQIEGSLSEESSGATIKPEGDQQFDVDIVAFQDADVVVVECKGIKRDSSVTDGDVARHFTQRLPLVRKLLANEKSRSLSRFKAIVITTGKFEDSASTKVYKARQDTTLELWNREKLLGELQSANQGELISIVEKYY